MDQPGKAKHVLFCNCGGERIAPDLLNQVDEYVHKLPVRVTKLSDLCGLAAHNREQLSALVSADDDFLVIGCYHRTMSLLFEQVSKNAGKSFAFSHINLIETESGEAIRQIDRFCAGSKDSVDSKDSSDGIGYAGNKVSAGNKISARYQEMKEGSDWPSWYPVIDYARCTACGQCADFCLFGVYEKTENRVQVVYPEGCKTNCPACGRICPATAIIFPKYRHGGAIGGSEDIDEKAEQQRQILDVESILGGDIYAALEKRKARRQSIIREEAMKKAYDERARALKENVRSK